MQWIREKLQQRGAKPFEFVQTVTGYDPSQSSAHGSYTGKELNSLQYVIVLFSSSVVV